jgi:uncharacterized membrane protein YgdD (TMEM256/DUF423 family)
MDRTFTLIAALLGFLGVALGAFGAHTLESRLSPGDLVIFETAVRYHLIHAVALLGVAQVWARWPGPGAAAAGWLFVAGIAVFSGSLYVLVFTGQRWWGAVTPIGGVALLLGWLALGWAALRQSGG